MTSEAVLAPGEYDRPRQVGGLPPKLAIHEIGKAAEEQADRNRAGDIIVDPQPIEAVSSREQDQRKRYAGNAPVERHAAIPQLEDLQRVEDHLGTVEDHIAEPAAQDDAQRRVEHQIIGLRADHRRGGLGEQSQQIPPARDDARDIGERVPAQIKRAERQRNGVEAKIGELDMLHRDRLSVFQLF